LGCAVAYGFHIALTGRLNKDLGPMAVVTVQLGVTALLSALALPFTTPRLNPTPALLGAVLLTGILASTIAIAIQVWAQARTSAVRAAVIYSLEPVFAVAYSIALGFGWPHRTELLGGAIVIAAVLLSELGSVAPRTAGT
jgi:drug/metabolite transporter (DMT)-like permease